MSTSIKIPIKQLMESTYNTSDENNNNNNNDDIGLNFGPNNNSAASPNYHNNNFNYSSFLLNSNNSQHSQFHFRNPSSSPNMTNSNNVTFRQMMHRPSVRSISETPNVIGAQAIDENYDICTYILTILTWLSIILFFPLSIAFIFRVVQEYER